MRFSFIKVVFFLSRRRPTCAGEHSQTWRHMHTHLRDYRVVRCEIKSHFWFCWKSLELCGQKPADGKHFSSFMRQPLSVCYWNFRSRVGSSTTWKRSCNNEMQLDTFFVYLILACVAWDNNGASPVPKTHSWVCWHFYNFMWFYFIHVVVL